MQNEAKIQQEIRTAFSKDIQGVSFLEFGELVMDFLQQNHPEIDDLEFIGNYHTDLFKQTLDLSFSY